MFRKIALILLVTISFVGCATVEQKPPQKAEVVIRNVSVADAKLTVARKLTSSGQAVDVTGDTLTTEQSGLFGDRRLTMSFMQQGENTVIFYSARVKLSAALTPGDSYSPAEISNNDKWALNNGLLKLFNQSPEAAE
jgi:hypothetical protein